MHEYLVDMGEIRMGIQPEMMKLYADAGYKILRVEYVEVTDVEAELANLGTNKVTGSAGGVLVGEQD